MTARTFCDNCLFFLKEKVIWCGHPDRDKCENKSLFIGTCTSCKHISEHKPCMECDDNNSMWEGRER